MDRRDVGEDHRAFGDVISLVVVLFRGGVRDREAGYWCPAVDFFDEGAEVGEVGFVFPGWEARGADDEVEFILRGFLGGRVHGHDFEEGLDHAACCFGAGADDHGEDADGLGVGDCGFGCLLEVEEVSAEAGWGGVGLDLVFELVEEGEVEGGFLGAEVEGALEPGLEAGGEAFEDGEVVYEEGSWLEGWGGCFSTDDGMGRKG